MDINANIQSVTTVSLSLIPSGTVIIQTIEFDNTTVTVDQIRAAIQVVLQAEFLSDKVTVTIQVGQKRTSTTTFQSTVASSDGSTAASSLPTPAIIGIIVGVVIVGTLIIAGVAIAIKKRSDDNDYSAMRA